MQTPAWHTSLCVQRFPSLHAVPLALAGLEHTPVAGLHTPWFRHWSAGEQTTVLALAQTPAWQVSPWVQALPSLHAVPSGLFWLTHIPVAGSHAPAP